MPPYFLIALLIPVIAIGLTRYFYNDSIPLRVRKINSQSFVAPGFERVRDRFELLLRKGRIRGSSFSAYYNGILVVDLMGGASSLDAQRLWSPETLGLVWSVSKTIAGLCVALLVQRGDLKYEDLVSKYWPEFGKNGKENITVEMLMTHRAGLKDLGGEYISISELRDNSPRISYLIEQHRPAVGEVRETRERGGLYHILMYGVLVDQLVRRVDRRHRSLAAFFEQEIASPLGLVDIHPAITHDLYHRYARVEPAPWKLHTLWLGLVVGRYPVLDTLYYVTARLYLRWLHGDRVLDGTHAGVDYTFPESMNNVDEMSVPMFSMSVVSSSRELARLFHVLALGGTLDGVQLFERAFIEKYLLEAICATNQNPRVQFARAGCVSTFHGWEGGDVLAGLGLGGQVAVADVRRGVSYAYITNHLPGLLFSDPAALELRNELYLAVEQLDLHQSP